MNAAQLSAGQHSVRKQLQVFRCPSRSAPYAARAWRRSSPYSSPSSGWAAYYRGVVSSKVFHSLET
jgi:hypothetical protein